MFYFYMFTYFMGTCFPLSAMMSVPSVLSNVVVRSAQEDDLMGLLELQSCAEKNGDSDKIVIVPKLFSNTSDSF